MYEISEILAFTFFYSWNGQMNSSGQKYYFTILLIITIWIFKGFCSLNWKIGMYSKRAEEGSICGIDFTTFCLYWGGFGEEGGDANPGYLG